MKKIIITAILTFLVFIASAQYSAVRVNVLGFGTGTINVGYDVSVSKKWSVDVSGYYNPIKTKALRCQTIAVTAGVRRWRFEPHVGAFWGLHTTYANYDFGKKKYHYDGYMVGVGASYGYSWILTKRWNFTIEGGLGFFYMKDLKQDYYTPPLDDIYRYHNRRIVLAPSKLEISFSYLF